MLYNETLRFPKKSQGKKGGGQGSEDSVGKKGFRLSLKKEDRNKKRRCPGESWASKKPRAWQEVRRKESRKDVQGKASPARVKEAPASHLVGVKDV